MKNQFRKASVAIAIYLLIVLSGCEKDLYEDAITKESNLNQKVQTISYEALKAKLHAPKTFSKLDANRNSIALNKASAEEYKFDFDSIKEFNPEENYQSYTIKAEKLYPEETNYLYKLLIENKNDTIRTSILTFDFKEEKLIPIAQEEFASEGSYGKMECYQIVLVTPCNCHDHGAAACSHPTEIVLFSACASSGNNSSGPVPGGTSSNLTLVSSSGGISSVGGNGYNNAVIVTEEEAMNLYSKFKDRLLPIQREFLNEHPSISVECFDFFRYNGFAGSSMAFIKNMVTRMILSNGAFTSIKPFVIEKQINDSELDPCSKGVLNQLKNLQQSDIALILNSLDNPSTPYITNIKTEQFAGNDLGQTTHPFANTYNIKIRANYVDGTDHEPHSKPTTLSIASSILHEIIHAHLHKLYDDYNNGVSSTFCNFPLLFDAYVSHTYPGGNPVDAHHEEMAQNFVNTIANTLQALDVSNGVTNTDPQVYSDLAWSTFSGTPIFDSKYPDTGVASQDLVRNRILNRRFAEARNQSRGDQNPSGVPCN